MECDIWMETKRLGLGVLGTVGRGTAGHTPHQPLCSSLAPETPGGVGAAPTLSPVDTPILPPSFSFLGMGQWNVQTPVGQHNMGGTVAPFLVFEQTLHFLPYF